jgi:tRNA-intron endonuclease
MEAALLKDTVLIGDPSGKELYESGWYGDLKGDKVELALIEAALLSERGKIEVVLDGTKLPFKNFFAKCAEQDPRFTARYTVYKDLRDRGLPVRVGFQGSDFRVYERGAKPDKAESIKWIVFASAEDYECALEQLGKAIKLAKNIRALALWAVVDNDNDVTYYIIGSVSP